MKEKSRIYVAFVIVLIFVFLQRFSASPLYKPVMDDWFLYGDIYENKLAEFIIPNEKFAIRPMAGVIDIFIAAPLFKHLWVVQMLTTILMITGAFLLNETFRENHFPAGGLFLLLICMLPMNMEATYWLAASIRISFALFFTGLSSRLLNGFLMSGKKGLVIAYCAIGFITVSFYETAIIIYFLISCWLVLNKRDKKYFWILAVTAIHILYIAIYYICNGFSAEMAARGHLLTNGFFTHMAEVTDMVSRVLILYNWKAFVLGFKRGMYLIVRERLLIQATSTLVFSVLFGFVSGHYTRKNQKLSLKRFVVSLILFLGGVALFYLLDDLYIAIRFVYFSFIGIGLAAEEVMLLLPYKTRRITNTIAASALSFAFVISGMGVVNQYRETSETDVKIINQLLELDTDIFATNPNRNTYLLGAEPYYKNVESVEWLESIRGACSSYADLTGCLRHVSGVSDTNNLTPASNGAAINMTYYIDSPDICRFFALDNNMKVINVHLNRNGGNFEVFDDSGSLYGVIEPSGKGEYKFRREYK